MNGPVRGLQMRVRETGGGSSAGQVRHTGLCGRAHSAGGALRRRMTRPALVALFGLGALAARAEPLDALIQDALQADPAILEARANEDVADARLQATRAQHWPTFGVQAGSNVSNPDRYYSTPFRGAVGQLNLYSAGAIDAAVERDDLRLQTQRLRTRDTSEQVAYGVARIFR